MVISCDCDNILFPLTEETIKLYNKRTDKNIRMEDITTYSFYECLPREDADGICAMFKEKELWDSLTPIIGAQSGIESLVRAGHTILVVTSTDPINFPWKCELIHKYFPSISTDNIIRVMDKSYIKCDVMIDDSIDNLISTIVDRVSLAYPWNDSEHMNYTYDIYRCGSWKEIVNAIKNIEMEHEKW